MALTDGAPGVYIEEKPSGSMPLQGVGTAVAAFVGFTETYVPANGDPTDPDGIKPQLVTSWPQYERIYGGCPAGIMLPLAVKGYFENGGSICFVVRIPDGAPTRAERALPASGRPDVETLVVSAIEPGQSYDIVIEAEPAAAEPSSEFTLRVIQNGSAVETHPGLSMGKGAKGVEKVINDTSERIRVQVKNATGLSVAERVPAPGRYEVATSPGSGTTVTTKALAGSEAKRTGYQGLAIAEDVTMVAIPDLITVTTGRDGSFDRDMYLEAQGNLVDWCANGGTRMAILDAPPGLTATGAIEWRDSLARDTAFGAAYYPHLVIANPEPSPDATNGARFLTIPPCGHVAGVWARTDATRGVWKAPANEPVRGVLRLENEVTNGEQGLLNPAQVNCIRSFGANGIRIWGARTLASTDQSWRYINVRRLFIYVEESIRRNTQWVVFEPNSPDLWARVRRTITAFLHNLWMQGALFGATPEQAFFVQCDGTNNPDSSVEQGVLVVDIGIAPVRPAEFVIFRISQWQGGAATTE